MTIKIVMRNIAPFSVVNFVTARYGHQTILKQLALLLSSHVMLFNSIELWGFYFGK
jgi:hypothetical protein